MSLNELTADTHKDDVFLLVSSFITDSGFKIESKDDERPWGGFFVIDEGQSEKFIKMFFPMLDSSEFMEFSKLSPKILVVAPEMRLSWQYHHRRAEIWRVIGGTAGVVVSDTDESKPVQPLTLGDVISIDQGKRHRLVGTRDWGIVAEIWKHTDPENPSDEEDIIRVEDDFGR